jgi:predicted nucleic acid-binding protein
VIDSSIGIAWVHADQATVETNMLLAEVTAGRVVVVPLLWFAEMANGLLALQRRKKITAAERKTGLTMLEKLSLEVDEESAMAAFHKTSELAERYGLTVYDATYLEVALRRKAGVRTRDEALREAARKCGLGE